MSGPPLSAALLPGSLPVATFESSGHIYYHWQHFLHHRWPRRTTSKGGAVVCLERYHWYRFAFARRRRRFAFHRPNCYVSGPVRFSAFGFGGKSATANVKPASLGWTSTSWGERHLRSFTGTARRAPTSTGVAGTSRSGFCVWVAGEPAVFHPRSAEPIDCPARWERSPDWKQ